MRWFPGMRGMFPSVLLAVVLVVTASCQKEAGTIQIGEYGSMTGPTATFGRSTHYGITMAINEVNAAGGIGGVKLNVVAEDDQGKPEEAATAVNKLISQDQVIAVLGEVASSNSLAGAPICQKSGVPMITPSSTNEKVTEVGDFIFRVCFIDPFQGPVMARFAASSLRLTKVAILRDIRSDYSIGLSNVFKDAFTSLGGTIVADESYQQGDVDFRAPLTAIQAKGPEAIFVPGYYTDVGLVARQARDLGISVPLLGCDGWDSPDLFEIGGQALEGCYMSNHYATDDQNPVVQQFISNYRARFNETPDAIAALGYDAARLLVHAIGKLAESDPAQFQALAGTDNAKKAEARRALRDILAKTRDFPGVTGSITLDEKRNAHKSIVVLRVQNQKLTFVERIAP